MLEYSYTGQVPRGQRQRTSHSVPGSAGNRLKRQALARPQFSREQGVTHEGVYWN